MKQESRKLSNLDDILTRLPERFKELLSPWKNIFSQRSLPWPLDSQDSLICTEIIQRRFQFVPTLITVSFPFEKLIETFYDLTKLDFFAFQNILELFTRCFRKQKILDNIPSFLRLENILDTKWKYRGWVIISCDKNSNLQLPMCPVKYRQDILKTFVQNPLMFRILTTDESSSQTLQEKQLKILFSKYRKHWSSLGNFRKKGELPSAYTLPKFSDIEKGLKDYRVRPIITYAKYPMKKTLSIVSIGLNFLISRLDNNLHFDLNDANQTKDKLEKMNSALPFGENTRVITPLAENKVCLMS